MNFKKLIITIFVVIIANSLLANDGPLWMRYPAISPDGQTIVFSYKGDLYTVASSGGDAKILTMHEAYDFMPVWSPDSKTIAFASNRFGNYDVFKISASGGKAERLTYISKGEYPTSFSPDGKHILFSASIIDDINNVEFPSGAITELYSIPVNGGREKQILSVPAELAKYDSKAKRIIFQDKKGFEDDWRKHHTSSITRDLWIYDVENRKHTKLTSFNGEDRWPVFANNDTEVYYLSEQYFGVYIFSERRPSGASNSETIVCRQQPLSSYGNEAELAFYCASVDTHCFYL